MEVHHHSHQPKQWKEYITEFLMLFLAVTLGFLAENLREHQIINHRIEKNKVAILKDLLADSIKIENVLRVEDSCIVRYNRVNHLLYLAKTKKITTDQLADSLKSTPKLIAYSTTLYMNNSSFKNLQSSGLLSSLEEGELKNTLATYYEVDFKAIEAANEFFDQVGTVFNNYYPIGLGRLIRENQQFSKDYELNDATGYVNFMYSLDKTKNILQSDDFIFEVQKFYNYLFVYRTSLNKTKQRNETLIKLLKSEIH